MYKAKYAFEGQEGEISLQKDDVVELLQKDDNGWWLVAKGGEEGWAPYNYLELVPPKVAPAAIPPPPPRTRPMTTPNVIPVAAATADVSSKPTPVFPGMGSMNGSATPWKKSPAPTQPGSGSVENMKAPMKIGSKVPPPVATKPKPPPVSAKPVKPSIGGAKPGSGKPPVPAAVKPPPVASNKPGTITRPTMVGGQLDLAAAVNFFSVLFRNGISILKFAFYSWRNVHNGRRMSDRFLSMMMMMGFLLSLIWTM